MTENIYMFDFNTCFGKNRKLRCRVGKWVAFWSVARSETNAIAVGKSCVRRGIHVNKFALYSDSFVHLIKNQRVSILMQTSTQRIFIPKNQTDVDEIIEIFDFIDFIYVSEISPVQ